jgi:hypothetical protein
MRRAWIAYVALWVSIVSIGVESVSERDVSSIVLVLVAGVSLALTTRFIEEGGDRELPHRIRHPRHRGPAAGPPAD